MPFLLSRQSYKVSISFINIFQNQYLIGGNRFLAPFTHKDEWIVKYVEKLKGQIGRTAMQSCVMSSWTLIRNLIYYHYTSLFKHHNTITQTHNKKQTVNVQKNSSVVSFRDAEQSHLASSWAPFKIIMYYHYVSLFLH